EDSPLATFERRGGRSIRKRTGRRQAPGRLREETDDILGRGTGKAGKLRVVDRLEEGPERPDDRPVRLVEPGPECAAADHGEGIGEAGNATAELGDETGDADAAEALEEDGRRDTVRCCFECRGKPD